MAENSEIRITYQCAWCLEKWFRKESEPPLKICPHCGFTVLPVLEEEGVKFERGG